MEFLCFDIGQVTLLHDLTVHYLPTITIKASAATADFEVSQPDWLVVDNWQLLQVDIHTNEDRFRSSVVEIKPTSVNSSLQFKAEYTSVAIITNNGTINFLIPPRKLRLAFVTKLQDFQRRSCQ